MRIIVGKIGLVLCLLSMCLHADISLRVKTTDGVETNQVAIGQPFLVEVVVDNVQGSVQNLTVMGLDNFRSTRIGTAVTIVNNRSLTKHTYQVLIDKLGTYTLGPAKASSYQQELLSNSVIVNVGMEGNSVQLSSKNTTVKNNKEQKVFARLVIDNDHVVVGQKITGLLRFYYQDNRVNVQHIIGPEFNGFEVKASDSLVEGSVEVNGVHYKYIEWCWYMYPQAPGEFIIPAYCIDYALPSQDHSVFGLFSFISMRNEHKRVYSNAVKVTVDQLPAHNGEVDAIGVFERIIAEIKPSIAKVGEGMIFSLTVEGDGNIDRIKTPTLTLPDVFKYYESHNAILDPAYPGGPKRRRFEFIIQGLQEGGYEIPEQLFTYFDVEKRSFVALRSSPLSVSLARNGNRIAQESVELALQDGEPNVVNQVQRSDIAALNSVGPWYPVAERRALPWWFFTVLAGMPFVLAGYPLARRRLLLIGDNNIRVQRRRALRHARKALHECKKTQDVRKLYAIFSQLYSVYLDIPAHKSFFGHDAIVYLSRYGFSDEEVQQWNVFCKKIEHAAYAFSDVSDIHELMRVAEQWMQRLEKKR